MKKKCDIDMLAALFFAGLLILGMYSNLNLSQIFLSYLFIIYFAIRSFLIVTQYAQAKRNHTEQSVAKQWGTPLRTLGLFLLLVVAIINVF